MLNWKLVVIIGLIWIALVAVAGWFEGTKDGGRSKHMKERQARF